MKKKLIIILFIIILCSIFIFYRTNKVLKIENNQYFKKISKKEYNNFINNKSGVIYFNKDNKNEIILLTKLAKENNVIINYIDTKSKYNILYVKNGKMIYKSKEINKKDFNKYLKQIYSDTCVHKNGC